MRKTAILTLIALICTVISFAQSANFTANTTSGCSPLVVNFQDQSLGNPTSWFWEFGNGGTSTLQNPSATYFTPGTYTVKLTVTNAQGSNTLTRTDYIRIYGKPVIDFAVNDAESCFPHPAQFTDLSQPAVNTTNSSWLWDFGDGTQSNEQNPLHVYTQSGNYTVTLKVTNDKGCYSVLTKQAYIKIAGGVVADFTSTQPTVCRPPFNITFTNSSTGPGTMTWLWDFGDGQTSTLQHPVHTYTTPGNYTVTLTASSSGGCTDSVVKESLLVIHDINTTINVPDSVCINSVVNFLNTSTPVPDSSTWFFGNGQSSTELNPTFVYPVVGTYTVRLYNNYSYCSDSVIKTIRVTPRPVANYNSDTRFRCAPPLTVNFQDQSSSAVAWLWDFGDGQTSTLQNPAHTYTDFGEFDVSLIVTNSSGCTDTIFRNNFVRIKKPVINFPDLPVKGCIPFTMDFSAGISTLDNVVSWSWNFGDGNTSNLPNPTHTYNTQGTYNVSLTITTSTGCTETRDLVEAVTVGNRPVLNFSATPTTVCAFQPIQFTDQTSVADQWLWVFGDGGTSTVQNPSYQYSDTGTFSVTLYATNNGCMDSLEIVDYITVKPPIAKFGFETSCVNRLLFNFRDSSIGATSWFWDFGDGQTSNDQHPVHLFPDFATYNVSLTVTNDTCSHTVVVPVKVIRENPDFAANETEACKTANIGFTVTNTNSNIAGYEWNFGNGDTHNTSSTTASSTFSNSGYYSVTLIASDIYGCKDTTTKNDYIRINGPIANFSATDTSGCKGLTTTFNDLSTDDGISPIVGWQWHFGDSSIQNFNSPPFQHSYADTGLYTVKLVVTDAGGCKDSLTIADMIRTTSPHVEFLSLDTLSCPLGNVRFREYVEAESPTYLWHFGDDSTSHFPNPTHNYLNTGYYTVTLVITDKYGCTDSSTREDYIHIIRPVASFTVNDSISSCTPFEVQFTNTSEYDFSSQWDLGTGMSTVTNPTTFYNAPGTYNITLIVRSRGNCYDTAYGNIIVFDTTGSRVDYSPLEGCKPLDVQLSAFSPGPMELYTWDFGDGVLISTSDTFTTHVYNAFGNFVPKVILTDPAGCIIPVSGHDTIRIKGATVKFGLDNNFYCDSGFVNFIDSTTFNDSISVYHWDFGDGHTSNLQNPGHYYDAPGLYTVTLNVETQDACVDTFRITHAVRIIESPLVAIGGDSVICVFDSMQHLGVFQRPDTSLVQWQWQFPNGNTSTLQNPLLQQYVTAGDFNVNVIATNSSGCADTTLRMIRVNPLPEISLPSAMTMQAGFPVTIPAQYSSNVMSYNWSPGATLNCTDCPQPVASPKFNTKYHVAFADSNGCRNTGEIQIIVICKDANVYIPNTFSPNGDGSNDVFYVRGRGLERVKSLRIFNRWGEVVFEQQQFPPNDPAFGWNGKFKGNKPFPDVYVYQVEVFCENSQLIRFEGNVALIQ